MVPVTVFTCQQEATQLFAPTMWPALVNQRMNGTKLLTPNQTRRFKQVLIFTFSLLSLFPVLFPLLSLLFSLFSCLVYLPHFLFRSLFLHLLVSGSFSLACFLSSCFLTPLLFFTSFSVHLPFSLHCSPTLFCPINLPSPHLTFSPPTFLSSSSSAPSFLHISSRSHCCFYFLLLSSPFLSLLLLWTFSPSFIFISTSSPLPSFCSVPMVTC